MATPHPTGARETGWLPDLVFTGGRFETGLAFFADPLGRITRFSREPDDLGVARRLAGQAVLPGMVDVCSRPLERVLRGCRAGAVLPALTPGDVRDVARMVCVELLLSGVTCAAVWQVGAGTDETADGPDPSGREILRAARETGLRLAWCPAVGPGATADGCIRELDAWRRHIALELPGDETWLAAGIAVPQKIASDQLRALGTYVHGQRLRLLVPVDGSEGVHELAHLAAHGLVDKRLVALGCANLDEAGVQQLGQARAAVCLCPSSIRRGGGAGDFAGLAAAGATVAFGSAGHVQTGLLGEARQVAGGAGELFHALTVGGARSLGAPSGAIEVGRPADFFTVNLFDPSIVGAEPDGLLDAVVFALERRAIREVWVGGRQRLTGGRHPQQGPIVARYADVARRVMGG